MLEKEANGGGRSRSYLVLAVIGLYYNNRQNIILLLRKAELARQLQYGVTYVRREVRTKYCEGS